MLKKTIIIILLFNQHNLYSTNIFDHLVIWNIFKYSNNTNVNCDSLLLSHLEILEKDSLKVNELTNELIELLNKQRNTSKNYINFKVNFIIEKLSITDIQKQILKEKISHIGFFNSNYVEDDKYSQIKINEKNLKITNKNISYLFSLYRIYGHTKFLSQYNNLNFEQSLFNLVTEIFNNHYTETEFTIALSHILSLLRDGHAILFNKFKYTIADELSGKYTLPFNFSKKNTTYTVTNLDLGINGLQNGDTIFAINDLPISDNYNKLYELVSCVNEDVQTKYALLILSTSNKSTNKVTVLKNNILINVNIKAINKQYGDRTMFSFKKFDNNIYYLKLSEKISENKFKILIDETKDIFQKSLILDLRKYPGAIGDLLFKYFETKHSTYNQTWTRQNLLQVDSLTTLVKKEPIPVFKNQKFNGKIYILVNEETSSRAEIMALVIKNYFCAKIIGRDTRGAIGSMTMINLANNSLYSLTLDKYMDEHNKKNSVDIDAYLQPDYDDKYKINDPLLNSALKFANEN